MAIHATSAAAVVFFCTYTNNVQLWRVWTFTFCYRTTPFLFSGKLQHSCATVYIESATVSLKVNNFETDYKVHSHSIKLCASSYQSRNLCHIPSSHGQPPSTYTKTLHSSYKDATALHCMPTELLNDPWIKDFVKSDLSLVCSWRRVWSAVLRPSKFLSYNT